MSTNSNNVLRRVTHLKRNLTATGGQDEFNSIIPELVPSGYENECSLLKTSWAYSHIKWMVQTDALNQDMFLIGSHSPLRRWLAFRFCEVTNRECEFVALTSDTSESDLKSRRELRHSSSETKS